MTTQKPTFPILEDDRIIGQDNIIFRMEGYAVIAYRDKEANTLHLYLHDLKTPLRVEQANSSMLVIGPAEGQSGENKKAVK